jgi:hypothetical protein
LAPQRRPARLQLRATALGDSRHLSGHLRA